MDVNDTFRDIQNYQLYQDWVIFSITFLVISFVFITLKFKIDTSGLITLVLQLLISIGRLAANYVKRPSL